VVQKNAPDYRSQLKC